MAVFARTPAVFRVFAGNGEDLTSAARQLHWLRYAAAPTLVVTVLLVQYGLGIDLPLVALGAVIVLLSGCNLAIGMRLCRNNPVRPVELFVHLVVDVAALSAVLYYSGGSGNPFVSLFLLPLMVGAVVLPGRYAVAMAAVTLSCYSLLMFYHWPLPSHRFNLHVLGMWFNFVLSAGLILGSVVRMAHALRARDAALAAAREQALRDEQIVALGTLAAGTAHELGTPLATMAVLAKETEQAAAEQPELSANMRCLREQIETCKQTLARLRSYDIENGRMSLPADAFLSRTLEDWRRLRPAVPVVWHWNGPAPALRVEMALAQSLTNLINNAADASPSGMEVRGWLEGEALVIDIRDSGPGIAPAVAARAGKVQVTTKENGHGVGLLLANATIERLGGQVSVFNRKHKGACTRISVPLRALAPA